MPTKHSVFLLLYSIISTILLATLLLNKCSHDLTRSHQTASKVDTQYITLKPLSPPRLTASHSIIKPIFYEIKRPQTIKIDTLSIKIPQYDTYITAISFKKSTLKVQYVHNNHLQEAIFTKINQNFELYTTKNGTILVKNYRELPKIWLFCTVNTNLSPKIGVLITYKKLGLSLSTSIFAPKTHEIGLFFRL